MPVRKPRRPVTAQPWAKDAACATPGGRALIDLLADRPSTWKNCHVWERIRTLCDECPVKTQCRRLGEETANHPYCWDVPSNHIPYAGHPLKHYKKDTA